MRNEMRLIGDRIIGTASPLAIRFFADKSKPRYVDAEGKVTFTIGRVCILAGGNEIVDHRERRLALFLMNYGNWTKIDQPAMIIDQAIESVDLQVSRGASHRRAGFRIAWILQPNGIETISRIHCRWRSLYLPIASPTTWGATFPMTTKGIRFASIGQSCSQTTGTSRLPTARQVRETSPISDVANHNEIIVERIKHCDRFYDK